jgi:hypothetical protein
MHHTFLLAKTAKIPQKSVSCYFWQAVCRIKYLIAPHAEALSQQGQAGRVTKPGRN